MKRSRVELPIERPGTKRRTFLRMAGYGVAASALASCSKGPVRMVVPRLETTPEAAPGRAYWIATTCAGCTAGCGVIARCRDGRPVKLEGNDGHPVSDGGLCAVGQAQVLSLYDGQRFDGPRVGGAKSTWDAVDARVRAALAESVGRVALLTSTITSPSTRAAIAEFSEQFGARHVTYDALSASAILDAHERAFGRRALPRPRFDRAHVVASFDADFLGTWISPVEYAAAYASLRRPDPASPRMSRHVQFEARMSLTGSRADRRVRMAPWERVAALAELVHALAAHAGQPATGARSAIPESLRDAVHETADELWARRGAALVVCGANDLDAQVLACRANELLGAYETTLDLAEPSMQRQGDDAALRALISDMAAGRIAVLVIASANPVYDLPPTAGFQAALAKVGLVVTCAPMLDETAAAAHVAAPEPHALESWDDAEPFPGTLCLTQPAIPRLRSTRTLRETLARWAGDDRDDVELLRAHWRETVFPRAGAESSFDAFFDTALHDGWVRVAAPAGPPAAFRSDAIGRVASEPAPAAGKLALVAYPKIALLDGAHAHNAWLQELPDPVTKMAWDNYACLAPAAAARLGVQQGDVVRVRSGDAAIDLPVVLQPGQHEQVVAVALGYGRAGTDRFSRTGPQWLESRLTVQPGATVGRNVAPLLTLDDGGLHADAAVVTVEPTGERADLACTQDHHSLEVPAHLAPKGGEVRDAVRVIPLAQFAADPEKALHRTHVPAADLWPADHAATGHRWGMVVDLAACNGCSGCVVACQAENNVPAVGKDEVRRHREMQWLRIDRYVSGDGDATATSHQPMMCQHCANAPCETVCPVLATVHSSEGLNQQVYNRCVGTRYCANNCPYKARRFNWFDYPRRERLQNLSLNPDVTVRTRGVMEKCTMCVQRIQDGKAEAKRLGRPLRQDDICPACAQSCPAKAIVFGDLNDPGSAVSKAAASPRAYAVLGELNVKPSVRYLAQVRNAAGGRHGG